MTGCSRLRHIVRLRQLIRRWRNKSTAAASDRIPSDVPAGYVAVSVGPSRRRFVVRATHLNHSMFKKLLAQAEEEYGFTNTGPLAIPCEELIFEEIIRYLSRSCSSGASRFINLEDFRRSCYSDSWHESRPFLARVSDEYFR